jgi:hypothetical protein
LLSLPSIYIILLQIALTRQSEPVVLAELMPSMWSDFVRNAPMQTVSPFGIRNSSPTPSPSPGQQGGGLDYRKDILSKTTSKNLIDSPSVDSP